MKLLSTLAGAVGLALAALGAPAQAADLPYHGSHDGWNRGGPDGYHRGYDEGPSHWRYGHGYRHGWHQHRHEWGYRPGPYRW